MLTYADLRQRKIEETKAIYKTRSEDLTDHRRATLAALMRFGDIEHDILSVEQLADRIGLTAQEVDDYIHGRSTPRFVDTQVARYLAVPIRHWNRGLTDQHVGGKVDT